MRRGIWLSFRLMACIFLVMAVTVHFTAFKINRKPILENFFSLKMTVFYLQFMVKFAIDSFLFLDGEIFLASFLIV